MTGVSSQDEKEQLLKYSSTVGGIVGRTKSVVQLKARNPENPIRTSIPVKAICDYRQIEVRSECWNCCLDIYSTVCHNAFCDPFLLRSPLTKKMSAF